jgi:hypothetical protein
VIDQAERFERWRGKLGQDTTYLISQLFEEVLPIFVASDYVRLTQYGGPDNLSSYLGRCVAVQRQVGKEWPLVEFRFADFGRPFLVVEFAWMPETCLRFDGQNGVEISRADAVVSEGYVFFRLMRNRRRSNDSRFGISRVWPRLRPLHALSTEIEALERLSHWLIDLLARGMPPEWLVESQNNRVHEHAWRQRGTLALRNR